MSYLFSPSPSNVYSPAPTGGFLSDLWGGVKTAGKTAFEIQVEAARQAGATQAQIAAMQAQAPVSTTPPWLLPVALGGGALLLVLLLMPKKKTSSAAPVQNPGRRRRRRRR